MDCLWTSKKGEAALKEEKSLSVRSQEFWSDELHGFWEDGISLATSELTENFGVDEGKNKNVSKCMMKDNSFFFVW